VKRFKRILFVEFHNHQTNTAMYAVSALATYIRSYAEVRVIDGVKQDLWGIILEFKPDLIAMGSYSINYLDVVDWARVIKSHFPEMKLLLGGYHITSLPESFLNPPFDYAILGEGEEALKSLVLGEEDIQGLITGVPDKQTLPFLQTAYISDLAKLPVVDLPSLTLKKFYDGAVGMVASRGCYFNCEYCGIRTMSQGVRFRPVKTVVDEVELYRKEIYANHIIFWDDVFGLNLKWLDEFETELKNRDLLGKVTFSIHVRASTVTRSLCELWKRIGVVYWNMGLDFGSDEMLKKVKGKDNSVQKNAEALLLSGEYGFQVGASFIFGAPGETFDQMKGTLAFLQWLGDRKDEGKVHVAIWFFIAAPLPRTGWWKWGLEHNRFDSNIDPKKLSLHNWKDHLLLDQNVTEEQLDWVHEDAKKHITRINGRFVEW